MRTGVRLVVTGAVLLTACQDLSQPTVPELAPDQVSEVLPGMVAQAVVANAVPEFGGIFIDDAGRLTAYVTDLSRADRVRQSAAQLARDAGFSPDEIVFVQGNHTFAQLNDAFQRATQAAMPLAGAVFTDLDESQNQVVIGVDNAGAVSAFERVLLNAGLSADAFEVVVTEPIHAAATLRDKFDPTVGGIQIHFTQYVCTLGANANDGTERSFITNSHCTATQGGVEGTVYYQPTSSVDGTVIATEVEDPQYFKGGVCPRGKKCRYSDSSRAAYSAARSSTLGSIAITSGANNGSLTVTGTVSVGGKGSVVLGQTVNKVGRTTGWTQGTVSRTCVNTGVQGSQVLQLCQNWVENSNAVIVDGGDSGSSVWTGSGTVTLVGLLWGGSSSGNTFVYSPFNQVEQELGTLAVR